MFFTDRATVAGTHRTADGYLAADCRIARVGIQLYAGSELGKPEMSTVRVYRSPEEVFSADAMGSAAHKPLTLDHPSEAVTANKWKQLAVGWSSGDVARDGDYLRVPMMIADAAAIAAIEGGKRELSCGYSCSLDWTAGKTPEGLAYDARQTGIRLNHIAVVASARAGTACRFGDSASGFFSLTDAAGRPRRLVDRDTGRGFTPDATYIAAIHSEAAKAGLPLGQYVHDVLRYQFD